MAANITAKADANSSAMNRAVDWFRQGATASAAAAAAAAAATAATAAAAVSVLTSDASASAPAAAATAASAAEAVAAVSATTAMRYTVIFIIMRRFYTGGRCIAVHYGAV